MATYISPGVYIKEQDLSTYVPSLATTIVGMVGLGTKGPINEKVFISSEQQFIETFGKPMVTIDKLGSPQHTALDYLKLGNSLWYVRTDNGGNDPSTSTASESIATLTLTDSQLFAPNADALTPFSLVVSDETPTYYTIDFSATDITLASGDVSVAMNVNDIDISYNGDTQTVATTDTSVTVGGATFTIAITGSGTGTEVLSATPTYATVDSLVITATSQDKGTYLDGYKFAFSLNGYTNKVTFMILNGETLVESIPNLTFTDIVAMQTAINNESNIVTVDIVGALEDGIVDADIFTTDTSSFRVTVSRYNLLTSGEFAGGDDGISGLTAGDVIGTIDPNSGKRTGLEIFSEAEVLDITLLTAPSFDGFVVGGDTDPIRHALISVAEERADVVALFETPKVKITPQQAYEWSISSNFNSSYAAMYYPWVKVYDPYIEDYIFTSPVGSALYSYAYTDLNAETWFAPAGLNRAKLPFVEALDFDTNLGDRDLIYTGESAINPLVNFSGDGVVIWGQRTTQAKPSALDRVNVRRLMIYIEKAIAKMSRYLLHEPNTPKLWKKFINTVTPYLRYIQSREGIYDFKVICDEITNTPQVIDNNEIHAIIQVEPVKAAEKFEITFQIMNTGVIANESTLNF